jgi:hypothetical protein
VAPNTLEQCRNPRIGEDLHLATLTVLLVLPLQQSPEDTFVGGVQLEADRSDFASQLPLLAVDLLDRAAPLVDLGLVLRESMSQVDVWGRHAPHV